MNKIPTKLINEISYILSKRPDLNMYIDMLLFEPDIEKKKLFLKKIINIKEIAEQEELNLVWKDILLEYAKEISGD